MTPGIKKVKNLKLTGKPIYIYSADQVGNFSDQDILTFEASYRSMYDRNDTFCVIVDGSAISHLSSRLLNHVIPMLNDLRPKTQRQVIASAVIIQNASLRTVIQGLMRLYEPVSPMIIAKDMTEAKVFIAAQVQKSQL